MSEPDHGLVERAIGVLWGKSNAGGTPCLLVQHLLDAGAVGELIWDRFFAPTLKETIDGCCGGRGRSLFVLLCSLHDIGKATPAFQQKNIDLANRVRGIGLSWAPLAHSGRTWFHSLAGAFFLRQILKQDGWHNDAIDWVLPLIAGHHGMIPGRPPLLMAMVPGRREAQGCEPWPEVQEGLLRWVTRALDLDPAELCPEKSPPPAIQLALAGAIVMADWIASDGDHFKGVDQIADVSAKRARDRARVAWELLKLRGGWDVSDLKPDEELIRQRFSVEPRQSQVHSIELARNMPAPGLIIVEAPMGEGKTEAALAVVEVLAAHFGADGVFVGMPTQATSDPMFERVYQWALSVDPEVPVGLLHGRRRFNSLWRKLHGEVHFAGVDEYGCEDSYQSESPGGSSEQGGDIPAEWFLGPMRGLLAPVTVGTVDHLLHAATRTRHVMIRHTGLAGRVVVLDEVHAYDTYMSQFLFEALRWLADAKVSVVLLSATLPPDQRCKLVEAYGQGALGLQIPDLSELPEIDGYPRTLAVWAGEKGITGEARASDPWRSSLCVKVDAPGEPSEDRTSMIAHMLGDALQDGGCVLVVRNTVGRAQETYLALKEQWGEDVFLLHGRLTADERDKRASRLLEALGPPVHSGVRRPDRLVVVATQVAEQSFDVDVDLLVTDLAPMDLMLQRVGRLHRHHRPQQARPLRLRQPRVVVTGVEWQGGGAPRFPRGSEVVYGRHPLFRAAALVQQAACAGGWRVPAEVPRLVAQAYGDDEISPPDWADEARVARREWEEKQKKRSSRAAEFLLAKNSTLPKTLWKLHERGTKDLPDEAAVARVVRDGPPSVEVALVRRSEHGYLTLSGRWLGVLGEAISDKEILEEVVGSVVRLTSRNEGPKAFPGGPSPLSPLAGWSGDPWLRRIPALEIDENETALFEGRKLIYSTDLGIVDTGRAQ